MVKYDPKYYNVSMAAGKDVEKLYFYLHKSSKLRKLEFFKVVALATTKEQAVVNLMEMLENIGKEEVKIGYYENVSAYIADNINKYELKEIEI